jgi:hypothetical protein
MDSNSTWMRKCLRRWGMSLVIPGIVGLIFWMGVKWPIDSKLPAEPLQLQGLDADWPSPLDLPDAMPYDKVVWLCSHNAMSNGMDGWVCPNQNWNIPSQLQAGIHAQMWDVWLQGEELVLRHGNETASFPGAIPLRRAFGMVGEYLRNNPRAIVTLILESYVPNASIRKVAGEAGVFDFCTVLPVNGSWPTLGEMRAQGKRLVMLTDRPDGVGQWPMPVWEHCVETPWKNKSADAMDDAPGRGREKNRFLIVNHLVSAFRPSRATAETINAAGVLQERIRRIQARWGRQPNFWVMDFVDIGDGRTCVHDWNKAWKAGNPPNS